MLQRVAVRSTLALAAAIVGLLPIATAADHANIACHELVDAAQRGDIVAVKASLKAGVNPNCSSDDTPNGALCRAISGHHVATVKALLEAGADANARHHSGIPVLLMASGLLIGDPNAQIVHALLDSGAKVNAQQNEGGLTALEVWMTHADSTPGRQKVIKALKAAGGAFPDEL